jgi:hypothetical protein
VLTYMHHSRSNSVDARCSQERQTVHRTEFPGSDSI